MTLFLHDESLLLAFRGGDRDALAIVYRHYVDAVEILLRRCMVTARGGTRARGTHCDLSDVLQDVFVKAFATPARVAYDGRREYRPLLMTITRNTLVDHLRGLSRETHRDQRALEGLVDAESAGETVPWADAQTIFVAERYVAGLDDLQRSVYEERYLRCRSQERSAQTLGISRQRVRTIEGKLLVGLARAISRAELRVSALRSGGWVSAADELAKGAQSFVEHAKKNNQSHAPLRTD